MNPLIGSNFIDANVLDRTGGPEDAAVDTILEMKWEGVFTLLLPYSVKAEIEHPNTPADVKQRAAGLIYSIPVQLTPAEVATHQRVRALIQGNAKPGQHANDAFHLVESAKYGRCFITNDGRLLKKAGEIFALLQLRVIKPTVFLAAVMTQASRSAKST